MAWWQRFVGTRGTAQDVASTGAAALPPAPPVEEFAGTGVDLPPLVSLGRTTSGTEPRALRLPADGLLPWWHRVRAVHATTGHWPVLLGSDPGDLFRALPAAAVDDYDPGAAGPPAPGHPRGRAGGRARPVRLLLGRRRAGRRHGHAARRGPGRPVVLVLLVGLTRCD